MSLNDFLKAVASELESYFPDVKSSEVHGGQFNLRELAKFSTKSPAFRVALYEFDSTPVGGGEVDHACGLSLAVITTDKKGLPREEGAVNLTERITQILASGERFGFSGAFPSESVSARNLYGGELSAKGVQLWEIRWRQTVRLGEPEQADGVLPSELYIGFAPEIGADHEDDYLLIEENA